VSAQLETLVFRRATVADAGGLAPVLVEGFETFREFSPPDFEPPRVEDAADDLAARLGNPAVWCLLAESSADVAGYVSLLPAAEARRPVGDPGLAHLSMLYVRAAWWGTGLAKRLHAAACEAAATQGYAAMRLFTLNHQGPARRFYERAGWVLADGPYFDEERRVSVVEYRRPVA